MVTQYMTDEGSWLLSTCPRRSHGCRVAQYKFVILVTIPHDSGEEPWLLHCLTGGESWVPHMGHERNFAFMNSRWLLDFTVIKIRLQLLRAKWALSPKFLGADQEIKKPRYKRLFSFFVFLTAVKIQNHVSC